MGGTENFGQCPKFCTFFFEAFPYIMFCQRSFYTDLHFPFLILEFRCNRNADCNDESDERDCRITVIDEKNYLKDQPRKNAVVKVKIELLEIFEIREVKMIFRNQFKIHMEWFDSRITFYNLHDNPSLNTLVENEKRSIWSPSLVFQNTDNKIQTVIDKESRILVKKQGSFHINSIDNLDNVYMYEGSENPLIMDRVHHVKW